MKKILFIVLGLLIFSCLVRSVFAVENEVEILDVTEIVKESTDSAEATSAGQLKIEEVVKEDITERTSSVKGKLEGYLTEKEIAGLGWNNFVQVGIRQAVAQGVSANTIVLVTPGTPYMCVGFFQDVKNGLIRI